MQSSTWLTIAFAVLCSCAFSSPPYPRRHGSTFVPVFYDIESFPEVTKMNSIEFTQWVVRNDLPLYKLFVDPKAKDNTSWFDIRNYIGDTGAVQFVPFSSGDETLLYYIVVDADMKDSMRAVFSPFPPQGSNCFVVPDGEDPGNPTTLIPAKEFEFPGFDMATFVATFFERSQTKTSGFTREYGLDADPTDIPYLYHLKDAPDLALFRDSRQLTSAMQRREDDSLPNPIVPYIPTPNALVQFVPVCFSKKPRLLKITQDNLVNGEEVPVMHYYFQYNDVDEIWQEFFPDMTREEFWAPGSIVEKVVEPELSSLPSPACESPAADTVTRSSSVPAVNSPSLKTGMTKLSASSPEFHPISVTGSSPSLTASSSGSERRAAVSSPQSSSTDSSPPDGSSLILPSAEVRHLTLPAGAAIPNQQSGSYMYQQQLLYQQQQQQMAMSAQDPYGTSKYMHGYDPSYFNGLMGANPNMSNYHMGLLGLGHGAPPVSFPRPGQVGPPTPHFSQAQLAMQQFGPVSVGPQHPMMGSHPPYAQPNSYAIMQQHQSMGMGPLPPPFWSGMGQVSSQMMNMQSPVPTTFPSNGRPH